MVLARPYFFRKLANDYLLLIFSLAVLRYSFSQQEQWDCFSDCLSYLFPRHISSVLLSAPGDADCDVAEESREEKYQRTECFRYDNTRCRAVSLHSIPPFLLISLDLARCQARGLRFSFPLSARAHSGGVPCLPQESLSIFCSFHTPSC